MNRSVVPRMVAAGAVSSASTTVRIGAGWIGLWSGSFPRLAPLAARTVTGESGGRAEATLRDEVIAVLRDSAELCWLEMRRGVDQFDAATRPRTDAAAQGVQPRRRYRVKP